MRTRVKYCGICTPEEARQAAALGVDAIGLVFYPPSVRVVETAQAAEIARAVPPFVTRVALFLDAAEDEVHEVLRQVPIDLLQFHGTETAAYCTRFGVPYLKSVGRDEHDDIAAIEREHEAAVALVLDSNLAGAPGGSGRRFDWAGVRPGRKPVILAGGLNVDNVAAAIRDLSPYAVDVSSGIEEPRGRKSARLMEAFMREVHLAGRAWPEQTYAAAGRQARPDGRA